MTAWGRGPAPLQVLVTRPHAQAGELIARLRAGGMRCLVEPMLTIVPQPWDAGAALCRRQAVLLTSPNGAEALVRATGMTAEGLAGLPPVLAVGAATAHPLRRAGLAGVEAANGTARDLLRLVQARLNPHSGPIAYLSAETVACDLATALAPTGFVVERSVVYAAWPPARLSARARDAIAGGAIQVAPFLSARAATAFCHLLAQEGLEGACRGMVGIALSQRIAAAMAPLPWRMLETAGRPDLDGLIAALYRSLACIVDETFS